MPATWSQLVNKTGGKRRCTSQQRQPLTDILYIANTCNAERAARAALTLPSASTPTQNHDSVTVSNSLSCRKMHAFSACQIGVARPQTNKRKGSGCASIEIRWATLATERLCVSRTLCTLILYTHTTRPPISYILHPHLRPHTHPQELYTHPTGAMVCSQQLPTRGSCCQHAHKQHSIFNAHGRIAAYPMHLPRRTAAPKHAMLMSMQHASFADETQISK